jgi:hypothetical protein
MPTSKKQQPKANTVRTPDNITRPVDVILLAVERGQALVSLLNQQIPPDDTAENRALFALTHSISSQFEVIEAQTESKVFATSTRPEAQP